MAAGVFLRARAVRLARFEVKRGRFGLRKRDVGKSVCAVTDVLFPVMLLA